MSDGEQFHVDPTAPPLIRELGELLEPHWGSFQHEPGTLVLETVPGGGGQGAAVADQGAQPPAGQGAPQPGTQPSGDDGGDFWGMFPEVPEEHRAILEPVLKRNVLPHVTKLEQSLAPFKPLLDSGMDPQTAQGLIGFSNAFDQDPKGTWLNLTRSLQEEGIIHEDLDLELLQKIADGEDVPEEGEEPLPQGAEQPELQPGEELPPWAQEMKAKLDAQEEEKRQREVQQQQAREDRLLEQQMGTIRSELTKAGISDEAVSDETIIGQIIANKGDAQQAIKAIVDLKTNLLKSVTEARDNGSKELDLSNGVPPVEPKKHPRDSFEAARSGALQHLRQSKRSQD